MVMLFIVCTAGLKIETGVKTEAKTETERKIERRDIETGRRKIGIERRIKTEKGGG